VAGLRVSTSTGRVSQSEVASGGKAGKIRPGQELDIAPRGDQGLVEALLQSGGFPEPFLAQSARSLRRWQKERLDRFFSWAASTAVSGFVAFVDEAGQMADNRGAKLGTCMRVRQGR
jgi:hypothetical protein